MTDQVFLHIEDEERTFQEKTNSENDEQPQNKRVESEILEAELEKNPTLKTKVFKSLFLTTPEQDEFNQNLEEELNQDDSKEEHNDCVDESGNVISGIEHGCRDEFLNEDVGSAQSRADLVGSEQTKNDESGSIRSRSPPTLTFTSEWYYENPKVDTPSQKSETSDDDFPNRRLSVDTFNAESDTDSELPPQILDRRSSKWSATILFVASEIQMIIDLAEFSPDEAFLTAPKKVGLLIFLRTNFKRYLFWRIFFLSRHLSISNTIMKDSSSVNIYSP